MKLFVDGLIFQKDPQGGIARLYREILPRMCDMQPDLEVTLFLDGPVRQELPFHPQMNIRRAPAVKRTLRPRGFWRTFIYPLRRLASKSWGQTRSLWIGSGENTIWHSTYYTLPESWRGVQVVTVHDMIHEHFPDIYSDALGEIARQQKHRCVDQARAVICNSETTRQDMLGLYREVESPVYIIPLACSITFHRLMEAEIDHHAAPAFPFLLYLGKRVHYKNFDGLIKAYSQWARRSEISLLVVGDPWTSQEKSMLSRLGISELVHLKTGVGDQELCQLYNQAVALVFPSLYEGFGIPLLEAMSCGCPIIASRIPSTVEVAGECPLYFELSQPNTLIEALEQIRSVGRELSVAGMDHLHLRSYSWERTARETLQVYSDLL